MGNDVFDTSDLICRFSNFIKAGKCLILCGAGISNTHPTHLPLAGQIRNEILRELWRNSPLIRKLNLDAYSSKLNEDKFVDLLVGTPKNELRFELIMQIILDASGELMIPQLFNSNSPNLMHYFIAKAIACGSQVITANFDNLIERAWQKRDVLGIVSSEIEFANSKCDIAKRFLLFKIHGTIERKESIIATLRQVGKAGLAFMWEPGKGNILEYLVKRYHLFVIGYSGTDDFDIMSKLLIIDSDKEVLWIKHEEKEQAKLIAKEALGNFFNDEILRRFLELRNANVIMADARELIPRFFKLSFNTEHDKPLTECRCKHKKKLYLTINRTMSRWADRHKGLIEFVAARLLFQSNQLRLSLKLFLRLENLFKSIKDHQNYARTLLNIAVIYENLGEISKAIEYQETANSIFSSKNDLVPYIDSLVNLGVLYMRCRKYAEAEKLLKKAEGLSKKDGITYQNARALSNLGGLYWTTGKLDEAVKCTKRSYKLYKKVGDLSGCAVSLSTMGKIAYTQKNDASLAEAFFRMAMEYGVRLRDIDMQSALWNNLGGIYRRQGKIGSATEAYNKALLLATEAGNKQSIVISKMGIVALELSKGNLDKALELGAICLAEGQELGLLDHVAQTAGNIGLAFLDKGQFIEALKYFEVAKEDFIKLGLPIELAFTHKKMGECLLKMQKREEAERMIQEAHKIYLEHGLEIQAQEAMNLLK